LAERVAAGTWVEIRRVVLAPGERAPQVPEDTQRVPLEMRAKGFLVTDAVPGEEVEIESAAGRRLRGTLGDVNPAYTHGFGPPVPELLALGGEARALLAGARPAAATADPRGGEAGPPPSPSGPAGPGSR
jgi:hypothetical protein